MKYLGTSAIFRSLASLGLAIAFLVPTQVVYAATITSTATGGAWNLGTTWVGGVAPLATDSVVIATTGANTVTFNSAKVLSGSITINAGATLVTNNFALTLSGDLINNGTFTAGSSSITLNGAVNQSISGFTTTGAVSMTKTAGIATFTGNVNGGALTINGAGGTLALGAGLTHTFSGTWTRTAGTLDAGSSTLNLNGALAGAGGTFTAGTSNVNYGGAGAQTVAGVVYNNLSTSGGGVKTTGAAVTINGNLAVGAGTTFTVAAFAITVNGSTSVTGTLTHSSATGAKTYIGAVTINAGGVWSNSGNAAINLRGGLTHNGTTFTGGTGVYTFDTNNQAIGGTSAISIPSVTVTGVNLTNNGTLTVGTALSGTGTLIQGLNAVLNIGNASAITGLNATVNPNTVNYNRAGAQTIKATTYHHLVTTGNGVKTTGGAVVVNGDLTVNTTSTFAVGAFAITVNGNTSVTGTLTHSSATGAKTYIGAVTVNAGGVWNNSGNAAINLRGGLTNNGTTFTAGTGVYTFDTNNQAIGGTSAISIPSVTVTGVNLTNNGTLTVGTALSGTGTLIQSVNAVLNIGNASAITGLTATANPNTVNYNRAGVQTVKATTYHHLTISGSGVKTIPAVTVNGVFSREGTATASAAPVFGANAALRYKGSAAQVTGPEFITPFLASGGVIIDNINGVTLAASKTINSLLTFINGRVITGANTLTIGSTGSVTGAGAGRYIFGNLVKLFPVGAAQSFTFDIGDAANYLPVALTNFNVTTLGSVAVSTSAGEHPNIATSGIDPTKDVNRFWTLTSAGGLVFTNYDVLFNFLAGDVDGGAAPGSFIVQRFFGGTWSSPTTAAPNPTNIQASGLSAIGSFAVGERARVNTTTTVNCVPNPVTLFGNTTCTATVTRAGGTNTPGGTVTWSTSGAGAFTPLNTCVLAGAGASTTCSVTYTPSTVGSGSHTVTASYGGDTNFNISNGNQVITVNAATPVITFGAPPTPTYLGGDFTVSAATTNTDSSALTYSVVSGPCAFVSGATFSSTGAGVCVVQADGAATANFTAASQTQSVTIGAAIPVITFGAPPTPTYLGGNFTVSATTTNTDSSALTYSVVSGPCAFVSGATFSSTGAGACVVQADGSATANFTAASQTQSVTIGVAIPVISFGASPTPTYLGGDFTVNATTTNTDSSTLTYSIVSGPCAFVSGATFSSTGAGVCVVQADGAATANFNAASQTQSITIGAAIPVITFGAAPTPTYLGGDFTVSATTTNTESSALTYSVVSGPCTFVSGATFSSTGAGACVVQANGAATANFTAASQTQSVLIGVAIPAITFGAAPTPTYLGGDFTVNATTTNTDSSTLTFSVVSGPCTFVSGATFSSTGAGACVVQADGTATVNFTAASQTQNITIGIANQIINVTASAPTLATSGVNFTVAATGGASGNPVIYSATGSCTNSGAVFTTGASGTCTVHYNQAGNANFNNAVEVTEDTVVDGNAPSTSSINLASGSPTNAASVDFTITFSEAVTGGTASNFSLITTGAISGASITSVSAGPGATRTVKVNTGTGDGSIGLDLINGTGITDIAGNVLSTGTFTGQVYTIIKSGPPVVIGAPSLTATIVGPIDFPITVIGATAVNVTNADITLNTTGTATGIINVTNGNTNNPTVTISGISGNGTIGISIAAGVASDSVVPAPNTSPAAGPSSTFIVDNIAPQVVTNGVNTSTDTGDGILSEFEVATVGVNQIIVQFTEDVSLSSAADVNNYMLVNDNSNGFDDTPTLTTCATDINPNGGNDSKVTINSASYNNNGGSGPFVSTLSLNNGTPLANGVYRLYVCGTTSITDLAGNELNRIGLTLFDFRRNFSVNIQSGTTIGNGATSVLDDIAQLPATGFPMGEVTTLPSQPADLAYTSYSDLWLEIPSLSIKMNIVGVPANTDSWNVSWLGNDAGWLNGSAFPTWDGNSVITGHVWDALNQPGPFADLKKLKYGDQIKVHAFGQVYIYEIRESKLISSSNKTTAFKHEEKSWVTLITCEDYKEQARMYLYRRMVRAVLVSVISEK